MADPMSQSVKQVLQALDVFSGKPDRESLEKANAWLQEFQHSVSILSSPFDIDQWTNYAPRRAPPL